MVQLRRPRWQRRWFDGSSSPAGQDDRERTARVCGERVAGGAAVGRWGWPSKVQGCRCRVRDFLLDRRDGIRADFFPRSSERFVRWSHQTSLGQCGVFDFDVYTVYIALICSTGVFYTSGDTYLLDLCVE
jgi:hypothetical protein